MIILTGIWRDLVHAGRSLLKARAFTFVCVVTLGTVRVTLGASRPRVIGLILFDVLELVAPGVAVGLVIAAVIVRLGGGIAVSSIEPLAYVAGAVVAILTAVSASLAPALRAASVQPMVAMRSE